MKRLALVIGHGPRIDKGAENKDGTTELAWNTDLANRIKSAIGNAIDCVIVHRVTERQSPVAQVNATAADFTVELHCNASDGRASGTEMICLPTSPRANVLAGLLQRAAVQVLKLKDRGVKPPWNGRGTGYLKGTRMPAVIVERFFIDNPVDLARANAVKDTLALAYANAFIKFASL